MFIAIMEFTIRPARREDCPAILDLVRELAVFEKSADQVTVSLEHFEDAGFGERPVWWAYVACAARKQVARTLESERAVEQEVQDPVLRKVYNLEAESGLPETLVGPTDSLGMDAGIRLNEAVEPVVPERVQEALPLQPKAAHCDEVVGFALYYRRFSTWKGERMFLEDIYVREDWRGRKVGTALMDMLIAAARAQNLHGISWQVLKWNESAIRFYNHFGVKLDEQWLNAAIDIRSDMSDPTAG
jgi:GNAT superfamily N-acetyltransferase